MLKKRAKLILAVAAVILAAVFGLYRLLQAEEPALPETTVDHGFRYLTVTPALAAYYHLEIDSGALVTEVIRGSQAEKAGLKAGDVIISFNGTRIQPDAPLLGAMMTCPGGRITMEVWRGKAVLIEEFVHIRD